MTQFKADQDYPIYANRIKEMAINNKQSFSVSFAHLKLALPTIAMWVGMHPSIMFPILNEIAYVITCKNYPTYRTLVPETYVKII